MKLLKAAEVDVLQKELVELRAQRKILLEARKEGIRLHREYMLKATAEITDIDQQTSDITYELFEIARNREMYTKRKLNKKALAESVEKRYRDGQATMKEMAIEYNCTPAYLYQIVDRLRWAREGAKRKAAGK